MHTMSISKAIIISDSEILTKGILACLLEIKEHRLQVSAYTSAELQKIMRELHGGEILICDCLSINMEKIANIRQNIEKAAIIGIYTSALPANVTSQFDLLISIYSESLQLIKAVKNIIAASKTKQSDSSDSSDELTPREKEVVIGVVKGLSNKDIASALNVSVHTITTHRRNIASKLQIHSASALTIYAIVRKLVSIDEIKSQIL